MVSPRIGESVHKAQTSDRFGPLPNRDRGGRGFSVYRRGSVLLMITPDCVFFLIMCAQTAADTIGAVSVGRSVRCAMQ